KWPSERIEGKCVASSVRRSDAHGAPPLQCALAVHRAVGGGAGVSRSARTWALRPCRMHHRPAAVHDAETDLANTQGEIRVLAIHARGALVESTDAEQRAPSIGDVRAGPECVSGRGRRVTLLAGS